MDTTKLPQTRNDSTGTPGSNQWDNYFKRNSKDFNLEEQITKEKKNLLLTHMSKLNNDIISTRNCWDYMLSEVVNANKKLAIDLAWNQKRIDLLKEVTEKLCLLIDENLCTVNEYIELTELTKNVKKLNLNFNKTSDD